ncbi:MAG: restriction endonuclease subunit S [Candidatus Kapabacteria bacterium]|nr:restriction endonuclease subunit S [Candidatus Kapabacteria bacterium]
MKLGENSNIEISGINLEQGFIPTVADMNGIDKSKYKLVPIGCFACNLMHIGRDVKIPLAYNDTDKNIAVSPAYYVFKIKESEKENILGYYLEILLTRNEFGRLTWFHTDSSIRGNLLVSEFCDIQIPLPSIEVQRELVATYNGLKALAEQNEALIKPLTEACQAYIVDCKKKYPEVELGGYINVYDRININAKKLPFCGINKDKTFMPTVANTNELDNSKYKIVEKDVFVFSGMQTGRDVCIRLALYNKEEPILVSPAYTTFVVKDKSEILPEYLFIQFNRFQMDRYGWFLSDGSIRSNLDWSEFCRIQIPLPPPEVQQAIVNLYNCAEEAKNIANEAREKMKILCPALVQRAINK